MVDDDLCIRRALPRLLRSADMDAVAFESIEALLAANPATASACIVSDVLLRGEDGLALPQLLAGRGLTVPIIFLTAIDDGDIRARAIGAGGAALLRKPVDDQELIDSIRRVLASPVAGKERRRRPE